MLRTRGSGDRAVDGLITEGFATVESRTLARGGRSGRQLRQPLRQRLRPSLDRRIALEAGSLQRGVARQREFVQRHQIVGIGKLRRQSHRDQRQRVTEHLLRACECFLQGAKQAACQTHLIRKMLFL
jgi:hypothetical protein